MMSKIVKKIFFLTAFLIMFFLSACAAKQAKKEFQLAVFDKKTVHTFKFSGNQVVPVEKLSRKGNMSFARESFKSAGQRYVTKTLEGDGLTVYLESIDGKTLEETIQPALGNDAYTSTTDGNYFYATAVFIDRIDCYKYDLQMKKILKKSIPNNEVINASNQFLVIDNSLYLLVSYVDKSTQQPGTCLWKMNKDFNIQEIIDLNDSSAYLRMANVGEVLYIPESYKGSDSNGEPKTGKQIMVFDLVKREKRYLPTSAKYPKSIVYNQESESIIIENDGAFTKTFSWTIHNLQTGQEKLLTLPVSYRRGYLPPFVSYQKNRIYFLFSDYLIQYDILSEKIVTIDLKKYHIHNAHAMILK